MTFKDEMKELSNSVKQQEHPFITEALKSFEYSIRRLIRNGEQNVSVKKHECFTLSFNQKDYLTVQIEKGWFEKKVKWCLTDYTRNMIKRLESAAAKEGIIISSFYYRVAYWSDEEMHDVGDFMREDHGVLILPKKYSRQWQIIVYCDIQFSV